MEAHDQILHGLLDMGQMLLLCGAEINRVEDTMTRLGRAYGAQKVDIFVITSDIVLTILFEDGAELTQTRRITKSASSDFEKLDRLNTLSRQVCVSPIPADEFREKLQQIDARRQKMPLQYLGCILTALGFTLFLGGSVNDALFASVVGAAGLPQRGVFSAADGFSGRKLHLAGGKISAGARCGQDIHRRHYAADPGRGADKRGARYAGRAYDFRAAASV